MCVCVCVLFAGGGSLFFLLNILLFTVGLLLLFVFVSFVFRQAVSHDEPALISQ